MFLILALLLPTSVIPAAELAWPSNSASDLAIFVSTLRFRIYTDQCSAKVPELKPRFESLMDGMNHRIQAISSDLLASDLFKDMKDKPVPAQIIAAFMDSFDDVRHNLERLDAASVCPATLQNFGDMDDDALKSGLTQSFTAVQNMIQKLNSPGAR